MPKRKSKIRLQFRLATLMVLMVACSVWLAFVANRAAKDRALQRDIEGTWIMLSLNGESVKDVGVELDVTIDDDTFHSYSNDILRSSLKLKVDTSKTPARMDLLDSSGKLIECIYQRKSDMLIICQAPAGQPRPENFEHPRVVGSKVVLTVLERSKVERQPSDVDRYWQSPSIR